LRHCATTPEVLRQRFKNFETKFLNELQLNINHQVQNLHLENIKIDIVGYKKRPRKTLLTSTGCAIAQPPPLAPVIFIFFKHLVTQSTVTVVLVVLP
jgi:hypothetical protein